MRKMFMILMIIAGPLLAISQIPLTVLPSGGNKKASVSERVGLVDVTIHYDRPGVKGREGKIWGQLVHIGFTDLGFGSSKSAPWRAGANENTTIEFSRPVKVEGADIPAGKYGFFVAYDASEPTLIFSKNAGSWGSFYYDPAEDILRVKVKSKPAAQSTEWLKYEFSDETESGATVNLIWEKLIIPFRIETDYVNDQIASFRQELRTEKGFIWQSWNQAANWSLQRNVNLPQALEWADSATSTGFGGDRAFNAWATKAQILDKLGRGDEAAAIMKRSLTFANMNEVHQYGRLLLQQKKNKEAFDVFKMNYAKYPGQFTTLMGMTRGSAANGDMKGALKYAQMALPLAPDVNNRNSVQTIIDKLKEGKEIN